MSLQIAAQHLATKGRGPDTELVHMTKGEIAGLQSLAVKMGGTLTINPDTGLVEASFLKKLLPMLAAAAAIYVTGGAAAGAMGGGSTLFGLSGSAAGALAGGATGALVNPNNRLMGALGGAMSGYSMGGIGDVLAAQGAGAANAATMGGAAQQAALEGITLPSNYAALHAATSAPMSYAAQINAGVGNLTQPGGMTNFIGTPAAKATLTNPAIEATGLGGGWGAATKLGGMALPLLMEDGSGGLNAPEQNPGMIRPHRLTRVRNSDESVAAGGNYFTDTWSAGTPYKAPYGLAAGGGISSLGSYSDGGQLTQGPGDGMSDQIPAQIGQGQPAQPARLAHEEFVFPADVVSHFGNGSSNAGAKYLYKVMDDIRMARTGRKEQGTEVAPEEFLMA